MAVIDHVVYAVRDLDAAASRFSSEFGLESYAGGSHPVLGTANRIVPLGESYLELLAPAPFSEDRFVGWMVRDTPLGPDAVPMQRVLPDGSVLSWRLSGLVAATAWEMDPMRPAVIEWDAGVVLPGRAVPPVGRLAWVRLDAGGRLSVGVERLADHAEIVVG
jgi:hypothetical protein